MKHLHEQQHPAPGPCERAVSLNRASNRRYAGEIFEHAFHRQPLPAADVRAMVNDFIFDRMIGSDWSPLQRAFVDKETAKVEALRQVPWLRMPDTLAIISMDTIQSADDLFDRLAPILDAEAVAKPTHASGAVTFLRDVASPMDLRFLFELCSFDYVLLMGEMQYHRLPKKIIVETLIQGRHGTPPDDYKFHCVHGEPLLCQVDHTRFGTAWSRLFRLPDFAPMHPADGLHQPPALRLATPDRIAAMVAAARALSAPFDFVRVDLYDGADGIYFGELTFTPGGSLGIAPSIHGRHLESETHHIYSRIIMTALRSALAP